jgi:hypothetical protein
MTSLSTIRYVGGFARAGSITDEQYRQAKVDPLIQFAKPVMSHMNEDHMDSIIAMVQEQVGIPVSEAKMFHLDRLGFDVS